MKNSLAIITCFLFLMSSCNPSQILLQTSNQEIKDKAQIYAGGRFKGTGDVSIRRWGIFGRTTLEVKYNNVTIGTKKVYRRPSAFSVAGGIFFLPLAALWWKYPKELHVFLDPIVEEQQKTGWNDAQKSVWDALSKKSVWDKQ
jgi:hypothetical protein